MIWILPLFVWTGSANATTNDFSDEYAATRFVFLSPDGSTLSLKGQSMFSFRDIEGAGGPGYDSITDTRTIGTRSPSVGLEDSMLAAELALSSGWSWHLQLAFSTTSAYADAAWVEWSRTAGIINVSLEVGHHHSVVARHEWGARESLGSRVYWGSSEEHLVGEASMSLGGVYLRWIGSLGMMRPLGAVTLNDGGDETGTLSALSYDSSRTFSGNSPVVGGVVMAEAGPFALSLFGFMGTLAEQGGVSELYNRMANYSSLSGDTNATDFYWWGGRSDSDGELGQLIVEIVSSREGLLERRLLQAEARYKIKSVMNFSSIEPWARFENLTILDGDLEVEGGIPFRSAATSQAITWDWTVYTLGASFRWPGRWVAVHVEHSLILEANGSEALSIDNEPIANNETTMQLELRF